MTLTRYQRGDSIEGWNDCPNVIKMRNSEGAIRQGELEGLKHVSIPNTIELLNDVLALDFENKISLKDLEMYKNRLTTQIETNTHLVFIHGILFDIYSYSESRSPTQQKEIKGRIIHFMTEHSGVTTWTSPLKRIITSL